MPLPEKQYYSLKEITERWHADPSDLHDFALHHQLEVLAWVSLGIVNTYEPPPLDSTEKAPMAKGYLPFEGYAALPSDQLRLLFKNGAFQIRRFIDPQTKALLEIHGSQTGYQLSIDDLLVSRNERDRFEKHHTIACACEQVYADACRALPSFNGRPSAMPHIRRHFLERRDQSKLMPSLQQEGDYLNDWAVRNLKDLPAPQPRTIMNAIRKDYKDYTNPGSALAHHSNLSGET